MSIKKLAFAGGSMFVAIVALAVCISARFSLSNITSDPYTFIQNFFAQWSPALGAASTIILVVSIVLNIYSNRQREQKLEQQIIRSLYSEIVSNGDSINTILKVVSEVAKENNNEGKIIKELESIARLKTIAYDNILLSGQIHLLTDTASKVGILYKLVTLHNASMIEGVSNAKSLQDILQLSAEVLKDLEQKFNFLGYQNI